MLRLFSASEGIHISLSPEGLFEVGSFVFTNAMLYGALSALFIFLVMRWAAKHISIKPTKKAAVAIIEMMVEYVIGVLSGAFGSREKGVKFAPVFAFFFIFIIFSNLLGITPFVSPAFTLGEAHLFRPLTADLNGTIALSVIAIIVVQVLSIKEQGVKKHAQHYFSDKPLHPINFFIGVLEVFSEFTRIISLSLRLFLNTAVGEILIAVFTSMILIDGRTPIAVIPILLFEVLVAYIQAYVFTVLTANYLGIAIAHADDHHDDGQHTEVSQPTEQVTGTIPSSPVSAASEVSSTSPNTFHDHLSPATLKNRLVGSDG